MATEKTKPALSEKDSGRKDSDRKDSERLAKLKLVEHLCSQFSEFAKPLLNTTFDKADDSLFDQADRSENNSQQQTYFETMRELRVSRSNIAEHFFTLFNKGWRPVKAPPLLTGKVSFDELSLLRKDELEELVATEAMVNRVKEVMGSELTLLLTRCKELNDQISEDEIPYHPKFLCQSFLNSLSKVELDISSKLILLKHYDRHLVQHLSDCYAGANHILVQAGILPNLTPPQPERSESREKKQLEQPNQPETGQLQFGPAFPGAGPISGIGPTHSGGTIHNNGTIQGSSSAPSIANNFDALRGLIHQQSDNPMLSSQLLQGGFIGNGGASASAGQQNSTSQQGSFISGHRSNVIAPTELAQTLGQIQTQHIAHVGTANVSIDDVKAALQEKLEDKTLNQVDNDALNLVSMLFEFILDDSQLSIHMKELLGRLQIPMLKVAVLDNSFFSNNKHPARVLLNGLARAGQAWSPQESLEADKVFQIVSKIVRKVVEDFDQDVAIFTPLNKTVSKLLEHQKNQQQRHEKAIQVQEEQNAMIKMAKTQAEDALESLCLSKTTPAFLKLFLMNNWVKVVEKSLLLEDSGLYEQAIDTAETLIWSTDAREIIGNRSEFLKRIPPLLSEIRDAALEYGFPETNMDALFDNLEQIHLDHSKLTLEELEALEDQQLLDKQQDVQSDIEDALDGFELMDDIHHDDLNHVQEQQNLGQEDDTKESDSIEPVIGLAAENVIDFNQIKHPKADIEYYKAIESFELGMLFEIETDGEIERKILTAIITSTNKYIFVDRHGVNRSEFDEDELARAIQRDEVKRLDDGLLFDRALEAVIGSLRQNQ